MGSKKGNCTNIPCHNPKHRLRSALPNWEVHPSLKTALDSLDAYQHWVSEIVIPIAFQWIEEHKPEVYAGIPKNLYDDIGVVISAAFDLVSQMPYYKKGLEMSVEFERERENGTLDTSKYNPVWTTIAKHIDRDIKHVFNEHKDILKHSGEDGQ